MKRLLLVMNALALLLASVVFAQEEVYIRGLKAAHATPDGAHVSGYFPHRQENYPYNRIILMALPEGETAGNPLRTVGKPAPKIDSGPQGVWETADFLTLGEHFAETLVYRGDRPFRSKGIRVFLVRKGIVVAAKDVELKKTWRRSPSL